MKRFALLPFVAVLATMVICLQSCEFFKKGNGDIPNGADTMFFCAVSFHDSLTVVEAEVSQNMKVEFPQPDATGVLADSIRAYLTKTIANNYFPIFESGDTSDVSCEYKVGEEQEYLNAYARAGMSRMVAEITQMAGEGWMAGYYNDYSATVESQTDRFVTLVETHDIYTGGAHGLYVVSGQTFRKVDGHRMGWDLFDMNKKAEIVALLKESVKEYFEVETDEELEEILQLWDDPDTPENELENGLPLPSMSPYATPEGISFIYQQYEIAAYAYGLPSGILSLEKVKPVLSEEGRALLGLD